MQSSKETITNPVTRIRIWYVCLLFITAIFTVRLFYLQVIRHNYYQQAAAKSQLKQYEIEPERGTVLAYNNGTPTPIVLNQTLYTLYTDPKFVKDPSSTAMRVQKVIGGNASDYETKMKSKDRYEILAKNLTSSSMTP